LGVVRFPLVGTQKLRERNTSMAEGDNASMAGRDSARGSQARRSAERGADLVTSQPVVITYPFALALAGGLTATFNAMWQNPNLLPWLSALILALLIHGLDWVSNGQDWDGKEFFRRVAVYVPLNTIILALSQTSDIVKQFITQ
jgi:hypothetical protein